MGNKFLSNIKITGTLNVQNTSHDVNKLSQNKNMWITQFWQKCQIEPYNSKGTKFQNRWFWSVEVTRSIIILNQNVVANSIISIEKLYVQLYCTLNSQQSLCKNLMDHVLRMIQKVLMDAISIYKNGFGRIHLLTQSPFIPALDALRQDDSSDLHSHWSALAFTSSIYMQIYTT